MKLTKYVCLIKTICHKEELRLQLSWFMSYLPLAKIYFRAHTPYNFCDPFMKLHKLIYWHKLLLFMRFLDSIACRSRICKQCKPTTCQKSVFNAHVRIVIRVITLQRSVIERWNYKIEFIVFRQLYLQSFVIINTKFKSSDHGTTFYHGQITHEPTNWNCHSCSDTLTWYDTFMYEV